MRDINAYKHFYNLFKREHSEPVENKQQAYQFHIQW